MIRDKDFNWQFWRCCYGGLNRELHLLLEFKPSVGKHGINLRIFAYPTNEENTSIASQRFIFDKSYPIAGNNIDLEKDWRKYADAFMDDYFIAQDKGTSIP